MKLQRGLEPNYQCQVMSTPQAIKFGNTYCLRLERRLLWKCATIRHRLYMVAIKVSHYRMIKNRI